jgi:hypothetical protein
MREFHCVFRKVGRSSRARAYTVARNDFLFDSMPSSQRGFGTWAVAEVNTIRGRQIWVSAAGANAVVPRRVVESLRQSSLLNPDGLRVRSVSNPSRFATRTNPSTRQPGNHLNDAEQHIRRELKLASAELLAIGSTRDMCHGCQTTFRRLGLLDRVVTPTDPQVSKAIRYDLLGTAVLSHPRGISATEDHRAGGSADR